MGRPPEAGDRSAFADGAGVGEARFHQRPVADRLAVVVGNHQALRRRPCPSRRARRPSGSHRRGSCPRSASPPELDRVRRGVHPAVVAGDRDWPSTGSSPGGRAPGGCRPSRSGVAPAHHAAVGQDAAGERTTRRRSGQTAADSITPLAPIAHLPCGVLAPAGDGAAPVEGAGVVLADLNLLERGPGPDADSGASWAKKTASAASVGGQE